MTVRQQTNIPVPKVHSWSSSVSNPVGTEYIIMEKAEGVPLFQQWGNMTEFQKLQLIKCLTKIESQLSSIQFSAYGNLYSLPPNTNSFSYRVLGPAVNPTGSYCVGPLCDRVSTLESQTDPASSTAEKGPCGYFEPKMCT
jgi:hypothetical protein